MVVLVPPYGIDNVIGDGPVEIAFDVLHLGRHGLTDQGQKEFLKDVLFLGPVVDLKPDDGAYKTAILIEYLGGQPNGLAGEHFVSSNPCHSRLPQKKQPLAPAGREDTLPAQISRPSDAGFYYTKEPHDCNLHATRS